MVCFTVRSPIIIAPAHGNYPAVARVRSPMRTLRLITALYAIQGLFSLRLPEPFPPPAQVQPPPEHWNPGLGVFQWSTGSVRFPSNFRFETFQATDTYAGKFTSPDGKLVVHLSAGNMAGTAATPHPGTAFFQQRFIEKSRIWISSSRFSKTNPFVHHLSFPDADCTNFSAYSRDETGREFILNPASTFRPALPPALESSCS